MESQEIMFEENSADNEFDNNENKPKEQKEPQDWIKDFKQRKQKFKCELRQEKVIKKSIEDFRKECPKYYLKFFECYGRDTEEVLMEPRFGFSMIKGEYNNIETPIVFYKKGGKADKYMKLLANVSIIILEIIRNMDFDYKKDQPYSDYYPKYMHLSYPSAQEEYFRQTGIKDFDIIRVLKELMKEKFTEIEKQFNNEREKLRKATKELVNKYRISRMKPMPAEAIRELKPDKRADINGRWCILCNKIGPIPDGILCGNENGCNSGRKNAINPIKGYHIKCIYDQIMSKTENLLCFADSFLCPRTHCKQGSEERKVNYFFEESRISKKFLETNSSIVKCSDCGLLIWDCEGPKHFCNQNKVIPRTKIEEKDKRKQKPRTAQLLSGSPNDIQVSVPTTSTNHMDIDIDTAPIDAINNAPINDAPIDDQPIDMASNDELAFNCNQLVSAKTNNTPEAATVTKTAATQTRNNSSPINTRLSGQNVVKKIDGKVLKVFLNPEFDKQSINTKCNTETNDLNNRLGQYSMALKSDKYENIKTKTKNKTQTKNKTFNCSLTRTEVEQEKAIRKIANELADSPKLFENNEYSKKTGDTLHAKCGSIFYNIRLDRDYALDYKKRYEWAHNAAQHSDKRVERYKEVINKLIEKKVRLELTNDFISNNIEKFVGNQIQKQIENLENENQNLKKKIAILESENESEGQKKRRKTFSGQTNEE